MNENAGITLLLKCIDDGYGTERLLARGYSYAQISLFMIECTANQFVSINRTNGQILLTELGVDYLRAQPKPFELYLKPREDMRCNAIDLDDVYFPKMSDLDAFRQNAFCAWLAMSPTE